MKPENTSGESSSVSRPPKVGFMDGLVRIIIAALPFAAGIGLITSKLPPWADEMAKLWGPGFVILGVVILGIMRYVPVNAIPEFIRLQERQAQSLDRISLVLDIVVGPNGSLQKISTEIQLCLKTIEHVRNRIDARANMPPPWMS